MADLKLVWKFIRLNMYKELELYEVVLLLKFTATEQETISKTTYQDYFNPVIPLSGGSVTSDT